MIVSTTLRRLAVAAAIGGLTAAATAQLDPGPWPTFKANSSRTNSVTAPGPAVHHAWTLTNFGTTSSGAPSIAANGDVYVRTNDSATYVYRISPAGVILATSPNLTPNGGGGGQYAGVTIGANSIWTTLHSAGTTDGLSKVVELNKTTLAVIREITNPAFIGMRGTPLMSTFANGPGGSYTLYMSDRNGLGIHAVDIATGTVRWTHNYFGAAPPFDQVGPIWTVNGKQRIAFFKNDAFFAGFCLEDNGDNTYSIVWEGSPESFNWFGSGALSADASRIYVTTFNDGNVASLWCIDSSNGQTIWSVPGERGTCTERNYFTRPAVVGNRIYCSGGNGVVTCFVDEGATYSVAWEYRVDRGEMTGLAVAAAPTGEKYVYANVQERYEFTTDPGLSRQMGELHVLRDNGSSYTLMTRDNLYGTMKKSIFAGGSPAVASDGSIYFGSGIRDNPTGWEFYKFTLGDPSAALGRCCMNDGTCQTMTQAACVSAGGSYGGDGTTCNPENPSTGSSSPNVLIPDGDLLGVSDTISMAGGFNVTDVNVSINIPDHTWVADLEISLTHGSTTVMLWDNGCQFVARTGLTATFDDEADDFACLCTISGSGNPSGDNLLSAFDGAPAAGDWTLTVVDAGAGDFGTLVDWSISLGGADDPCGAGGCVGDLDNDGDRDISDLAILLSQFGSSGGTFSADIDGDGDVDISDLAQLLSVFGVPC